MDKSIKGPMKRYLATITESIVKMSTLVLEAESPEALRRQIEEEDKGSSTASPNGVPETYTYRRGRNGVNDTWDIFDPDGECVVSIAFRDEPETDKAAQYEARAKLIVDTLNLR